jgi:hypothetical protein
LRNNDQPQAVKFYAKEMEFYRKLVKGNKSYSWSDRATLWFNKRTNNFGLSFWKPLRLLLLLSILKPLTLAIIVKVGLFIIF